jgi:aryl-alcohol dehydrogenase-like predicted oxidoreductase
MLHSTEPSYAITGCDFSFPSMGLGTWAWGDRTTWGMGTYDTQYNFDTIYEAYQSSVSAGVTLLDTAEKYGNGESERIIAKLLARGEASGRAKVLLATKFMPFPWKLRLEVELRKALEASLSRLQVPFVHLYQIHGPISLRSHEVMAKALAAVHREGLVKAVGVSNYSEGELRAIHRALQAHGIPLATNQIEYSLLRNMPEREGLLRACKELGVLVLAYSPLAQGRLTGKYSEQNQPQGSRHFSDYPMRELSPLLSVLRGLGEKFGQKTPSQVALNWLLCKGVIPIPGAKNKRQAEENAGALGWRLAPEDVLQLDSLAKYGQRRLFHRIWQHG